MLKGVNSESCPSSKKNLATALGRTRDRSMLGGMATGEVGD